MYSTIFNYEAYITTSYTSQPVKCLYFPVKFKHEQSLSESEKLWMYRKIFSSVLRRTDGRDCQAGPEYARMFPIRNEYF